MATTASNERGELTMKAPPTFRSLFLESLAKYSDRAFISAPKSSSSPDTQRQTVTFGEVAEKAEALASWMSSQGLGLGSRIALGGGNSIEWVVTFVAIHLLGGVAVCLNVWLAEDALAHCLNTVKPDLALVDRDHIDLFRKFDAWSTHEWSELMTARTCLRKADGSTTDLPTRSTVSRSIPTPQGLGPESDAVIFFSSGTSGPPKAVLSTQRMALTNLWSGLVAPSRAALRAGLNPPPMPLASHPQKVVLLAIPLFHVTGCLSWLMRGFFGGSKIVMMRKWKTEEAIRLIGAESVTVIGGVPAVVASIVQSPLLPRATSFETVFYGGAPPSKLLAAEVKLRWPKTGLVQGYGMTETNAYVCSVAGQDYVDRPDSTGPAVPVADIRIVHPETRRTMEPGSGQTGILLVRGPQVMKCYVNNAKATREAIDEDGWLDTGDIAEVDAEGFVYIRDRLKDIIIRGGENITSSEVENALYAHPAVSEAAAIGLPDERLGEVVGAAVSIRPGYQGDVSEEAILGSMAHTLPKFALPVMISVQRDPLPRNVNGKIVKKDLKTYLVEEWQKRQKRIGAATSRQGKAKL